MGIIKSMISEDDPLKFRDDYMQYIASRAFPRELSHTTEIEECADIEGDLVNECYDDDEIIEEEEHDA